MITWWKQPGGKTFKRKTENTSTHISTDLGMFEIGLFARNGYEVVDHGHKITAVKRKE